LHYDFRLERDGVFKSWALPKGVPERPGEKRLAIQVEDHTLEFGKFEGLIPAGEYGAGQIEIWDRGSYEIVHWQEDNILVSLRGERCQGQFRLVRFPRGGPRAWLLMKCPGQQGSPAT
jgi:bifunctional non-homologous end joining protein LigD